MTRRVLFSVLEVDDVVLDEGVGVLHVPNVQLEPPGHWCRQHVLVLGLLRQVHEVSHALEDLRLGTVRLHRNHVGVIG